MSLTERSILMQSSLLRRNWPKLIPANVKKALHLGGQIYLVGTGSSFHVAQWASFVFSNAQAQSSWDTLYRAPNQRLSQDALYIVCSHRGAQGITRALLKHLRKHRLNAVLLCAEGSPTLEFPTVFTSPREQSQAHTMSVTAAIAALLTMADIQRHKKPASVLKRLSLVAQKFDEGAFRCKMPFRFDANLPVTVIGGGELHAIAQELALKIREMCFLPAFAIALEEYLHGPYVATEPGETILFLAGGQGPRAVQALKTAKTLKANIISPSPAILRLPPIEKSLGLLFWGQSLALELSRRLDTNPDLNRSEDPRYARAKELGEFRG